MERYFGEKTPKLGFGLMRLPKLENGEIDIEQVKEMVDIFLEGGLTYFDTAFVYDDGKSEEAAREALVKRHPRDSFTLATKLNAWMGNPTKEQAEKQLEISLERTQAGYFDYYLLHAVQDNNYADWDNPQVQSRKCLEVARKHGKSVVVMEPVKGGQLANPVDDIKKLFKEADPDASYASWAIRFVASQDGIITVLSGMSNVEQVRDNVSYMSNFKPLDEKEQEVIKKAQDILESINMIPCTACRYCTKGCPMGIRIPDLFSIKNRQLLNGMPDHEESLVNRYNRITAETGKASDCIQCGQCESVCPQSINIIERLQDIARTIEP